MFNDGLDVPRDCLEIFANGLPDSILPVAQVSYAFTGEDADTERVVRTLQAMSPADRASVRVHFRACVKPVRVFGSPINEGEKNIEAVARVTFSPVTGEFSSLARASIRRS